MKITLLTVGKIKEKYFTMAIDEYKNYIQQISKIDDLQLYKSSNPVNYNAALEKLILDYRLLEELQDKLESSVCLRERKRFY